MIMSKDIATTPELSEPDKYFVEQRDLLLQEITSTLDSILNNLNGLNISLENSIAVGKEFESVSELWKVFYDGLANGAAPGVAAANPSSQDLPTEPVAAHQNAAAGNSDAPAPSQ
ncbi:AAR185Wp [Eremothecium gossypii ATCC 10895]|uniref:DASH complex subunit DAD1 n=1 Tax=Eremothecium gossypii (strain ATCC 10895 / CBS 109.51 / FGSC 9923 / NRRL Y-1056) TaxID=284811 RepID=DAD1_EREGS|nr:AAR185Wp [Eremothecium gossypii ATCC 10895]Q75E95.1 RecName: Full=DASH complex subunit DAD1; AltName: Full=Outer kinetochore protein DAD1 [Eremothecium gossypii ATCC 10895]AAS50552.1 AAR185Wp [Eremothecium gossypii ATCC 10895]AEY94839.1 FAAR185Wp [Eremothecium gossypii FDAG1]